MSGRQERIFNLPPVVFWIVALLAAIEGLSQLLTPDEYLEILRRFAFVPGRFTFAFAPDRVSMAINSIADDAEFSPQAAAFFLGDGKPQWWTPLTYAFLHGSWLHVGMNCLWFAAFGSAVARRFGAPRFLFFCAVAAIAGAAMHYVTHMTALHPAVGARARRAPAPPMRRSPGRLISAAFSSGFWLFAGSPRQWRPSPSRASLNRA